MKKWLCLLLAGVLLLSFTACGKGLAASNDATEKKPQGASNFDNYDSSDETPNDYAYKPADIPQEYWAVLNNEQKICFIYFAYEEALYLDSYCFAYSRDNIASCDDVRYALVTTGDGETMLAIEHYFGDILMLYETGGTVYGNSYTFRNMYDLCTNGVYSWNQTDYEGHHYGESKLSFRDEEFTSEELWQVHDDEKGNIKYILAGEEVSKDKLQEYLDSRNDTRVTWSALTRYPVTEPTPSESTLVATSYLTADPNQSAAYNEAIAAYNAFLNGQIAANAEDNSKLFISGYGRISDGQSGIDRYALNDVNGDGIPELFIDAAHDHILAFDGENIVEWYSSMSWMGICLLENGAVLDIHSGAGTFFKYLTFGTDGIEKLIYFSGMPVEESGQTYYFGEDGPAKEVSKEEWDTLTKPYIEEIEKKAELNWQNWEPPENK